MDPDRKLNLFGLFVVSAALMTLEVLQTRLFAYSLDSMTFYAAIGIAMLGMGASGTVFALWNGWRSRPLGSVGALGSAGFSVTIVLSHIVFSRMSDQFELGWNASSALLMSLMAVPYFFAGVVITVCLAAAHRKVHRTYLVNLLGSALGCLLVFAVLRPLGAPGLLLAIAASAAIAAGLFARDGGGGGAWAAAAVALVASLALVPVAEATFPFRPDRAGHLRRLIDTGQDPVSVHGVWDPVGRIEIHDFPGLDGAMPGPVPILFYSQDGGAASLLLGVGDDRQRAEGLFDRTLYAAGYELHGEPLDDVLVIGLGGGPDILGALHFGAKKITGVEVNESAVDAMRGPFAEFTGNIYHDPEVEILVADGRSFVRGTDRRFDLIQMSGVDTKAATDGPGAIAMSEKFLYTVEALHEFLDHLKPGGHISFLRFFSFDRLRLSAIAVQALRERGVEHPEDHFVVLRQGVWTSVIVGRDPIDPAALARLRAWVDTVPRPDSGIRMPHYDLVNFGLKDAPQIFYPLRPGEPATDVSQFFNAVEKGIESRIQSNVDLSPTTDDRPFFFDIQRKDQIFSAPLVHYRRLGALFAVMTAIAVFAIALPIPVVARRVTANSRLGATVAYFTALGMGFILIELGLAQKCALFLGHPSYAVSVVLAGVLVSAGLGSAFSGRFDARRRQALRWRIVPAIVLLGQGLLIALDHFSPLAAGFPLAARIAITLVGLFPLAFAMGMPFPLGLSAVDERAPSETPWAIGANGFGSVIGSSGALLLAMIFGYQMLMAFGFGLYLLAAVAFPDAGRRAAAS